MAEERKMAKCRTISVEQQTRAMDLNENKNS